MSTLPPDHHKGISRASENTVNMTVSQSTKAKPASKANNGKPKTKTQMHRRSRTGTLTHLYVNYKKKKKEKSWADLHLHRLLYLPFATQEMRRGNPHVHSLQASRLAMRVQATHVVEQQ
jgi:hypothetical protein